MKNLLIAVLIGGIILTVLDSRKQRKRASDFGVREDNLRGQLDSVQNLAYRSNLEALKWLQRYNMAKDSLKNYTSHLGALKRKYEKTSRPVPVLMPDSTIERAESLYRQPR